MTRGTTPTILIVEDERHLADLFGNWLEGSNTVRTAYDGEAAIDALDEEIDVVLLDRRMPRLSGDEVLDEITQRGFQCKVAMVTAVEPDFDILEMGFDDYLVKPVSYEELTRTVDRLLTRRNYDEQIDEYARLLSKKAALVREKSQHQLEQSTTFAQLEARIERVESDVDGLVQGFDRNDVTAVFRDLPAGQGV